MDRCVQKYMQLWYLMGMYSTVYTKHLCVLQCPWAIKLSDNCLGEKAVQLGHTCTSHTLSSHGSGAVILVRQSRWAPTIQDNSALPDESSQHQQWHHKHPQMEHTLQHYFHQKHANKWFHDNISNSAMRVQYKIHLSLTPGITTWFYTSYIFQKFWHSVDPLKISQVDFTFFAAWDLQLYWQNAAILPPKVPCFRPMLFCFTCDISKKFLALTLRVWFSVKVWCGLPVTQNQ